MDPDLSTEGSNYSCIQELLGNPKAVIHGDRHWVNRVTTWVACTPCLGGVTIGEVTLSL
jgi:hypothetical protein